MAIPGTSFAAKQLAGYLGKKMGLSSEAIKWLRRLVGWSVTFTLLDIHGFFSDIADIFADLPADAPSIPDAALSFSPDKAFQEFKKIYGD